MTEKKANSDSVTMVFVGVRSYDGKKRFLWLECSASRKSDSMDSATGEYGKQLQKGAGPGGVYTFSCVRDEGDQLSITVNSGTYLGVFKDKARVATWQARHKAASAQIEGEPKAKREMKERLDLERLEPLRYAYANASRSDKPHILAEVIRAMTSERRL